MTEKVYLAALLGRQVDGENVFLKVELASRNRKKIEDFVNGLPVSQAFTIEGVPCVVERSVLEIDIED